MEGHQGRKRHRVGEPIRPPHTVTIRGWASTDSNLSTFTDELGSGCLGVACGWAAGGDL